MLSATIENRSTSSNREIAAGDPVEPELPKGEENVPSEGIDQIVLQALGDVSRLTSHLTPSTSSQIRSESSLSQSHDGDDGSSDISTSENDESTGYMALPDEDDSCIAESSSPILLDTDPQVHIPEKDLEIIQKTMASIQIPQSAIPEWAKMIPESAWLPRFKADVVAQDDTAAE